MDEREWFLSWLKGEFATANAIIQALCRHLQEAGKPGEYDSVLWSIQQRRSSWEPILHRQRYFSVAEVASALREVGLRRQEQQNAVGIEGSARRGGADFNRKSEVVSFETGQGSTQGSSQVNVAEGMKLYDDLFDDSEISKLITLVNDLRDTGRRGQLQDADALPNTHERTWKRDDSIRVPIADEAAGGTSKGMVMTNSADVEPIPDLLQNVIERLLTEKVVSIKPDSTIIDFFHEGDHSQPHIRPEWFERPVCVLFLTKCEMSFGRVIAVDHPGGYQGVLKLSLSPGSMLVMQGRSADFTRHAIPSLPGQRILVMFVKSQPKKINSDDIHGFPSTPAHSSIWAPFPSGSPSHVRPLIPNHCIPIPVTGIMPARTPRQQLPRPNSIQPMLVPNPMTPGTVFPAPVAFQTASAGWPLGAPRIHPPPRLPIVPGTGVFLPSQSPGNSSNLSASTLSTENITIEPPAEASEENSVRKPNDRHTLREAGSSSRARVQWQRRRGNNDYK
ncbi:hypothetical protein DH2020_020552 [Rehmannia glutinosa]|uniref:Uncharacterized protein n=1 Tax=Rehmannia glutinosa TaxID=99300 RepID=A0ABR0WGK2_REHGL